MALSYQGNKSGSSFVPTVSRPIDIRTVVDSVNDLTNGTIPYLYQGIVVNVKGTGDLYILTTSVFRAKYIESWKRIGANEDLSQYVKFEDLPEYLSESELENYAKKSDIPSVEGLASEQWVGQQGYLTDSDLDDYAKKSDIPDVSGLASKNEIPSVEGLASEEWVGQQGYLTSNDLPDYLIDSDLDDYAKKSDIPDISNLATKNEIPSVEGLASEQWVGQQGYLTMNDLPDYLLDSDLDDYAKKSDIPTVPTNISSFTNDAGYLTTSILSYPITWKTNGTMAELIQDINDDVTATVGKIYLSSVRLSDLPVSTDTTWYNKKLVQAEMKVEIMAQEAGIGKVIVFTVTSTLKPYHWEYTSAWGSTGEWKSFLTEHQDISGKANSADLANVATTGDYSDLINKPSVPTTVSSFTNDAGYITVNDLPDYLSDSDLDDYALKSELPTAGSFPADSDIEDVNAYVDGMATVQDVMDYVQAYFEKKKDELDNGDSDVPVVTYAYITGYLENDTPTDITCFNQFVLNDSGNTVLEIVAPAEISTFDPDSLAYYPSVKFTVDIPVGYSITGGYLWNEHLDDWDNIMLDYRRFETNPRYSQRTINGITYNSYVRGMASDETANNIEKYKIIITKQ